MNGRAQGNLTIQLVFAVVFQALQTYSVMHRGIAQPNARALSDDLRAGIQGRGKQEIPEKTRRPAASSGTIPTCENQGVTPPGIERASPRMETCGLTTTPLLDLLCVETTIEGNIIQIIEKVGPRSVVMYTSYMKYFVAPIHYEPFLKDVFLFGDAHEVANPVFRIACVLPPQS
ncbi:hypothetical protein PR048_004390 [Dryococelus australis]|uniref:Uncharacterized protein n=1 Tax=Dryococelus australis TaxID=614101 RepID=A0ABQ9I5B4_9NEOP|nr:hypothetical protein PR048_004390 [Dryococelus australis]